MGTTREEYANIGGLSDLAGKVRQEPGYQTMTNALKSATTFSRRAQKLDTFSATISDFRKAPSPVQHSKAGDLMMNSLHIRN